MTKSYTTIKAQRLAEPLLPAYKFKTSESLRWALPRGQDRWASRRDLGGYRQG